LRFLLATQNEGKLRELEAVLGDLGIELVSLASLGPLPAVVEDGETFTQNARKKACHYFKLTRIPTIADDSGLSVSALQGRPGVHSARFAATDKERLEKLLSLLNRPDSTGSHSERSAKFVCAICLVLTEEKIIEVEAEVWGEITLEPRGQSGFGYDPVFLYPPLGRTFAELSPTEKNRVSHRARALQQLKDRLFQMSTQGALPSFQPSTSE
jgi:XTP/dITP diphosphohydrolase